MIVKKIDDTHVSVTATEKQWAELSMIIDWVVTEGGDMDGATVPLDSEEISLILKEWGDTTNNAISQ